MGLYSWLILENQKYTMVRDFPKAKMNIIPGYRGNKMKIKPKESRPAVQFPTT